MRNRQLPFLTTVEHRNSEENELENPREPLLSEEIQESINGSVSGHEIQSQSPQKQGNQEIMKCMTIMQQQMMTQMNVMQEMQKMMHTMMTQSPMHYHHYDYNMNSKELVTFNNIQRQPVRDSQFCHAANE